MRYWDCCWCCWRCGTSCTRKTRFFAIIRFWDEDAVCWSGWGPKLRQYIVAANDEERPFTRDQRKWIYHSSEKKNNYAGFGTDNDIESQRNYLIIKHSPFPLGEAYPGDPEFDKDYRIPVAKVLGGFRKRTRAFSAAIHRQHIRHEFRVTQRGGG